MCGCLVRSFDLDAATLQFHQVFELPIGTRPGLPDAPQVQLREDLFAEEMEEFYRAVASNDRVLVADGLADMAYVLSGTAHVFGVKLAPVEHVNASIAVVFERYKVAVKVAVEVGNLAEVIAVMTDLMSAVYAAAHQWRIPLDAVVAEVHRSNMSKLAADGRPLYFENGKVDRGPNYFPPNIAGVLGSPTPL